MFQRRKKKGAKDDAYNRCPSPQSRKRRQDESSGIVSITIDDEFVVHDIKIIEGVKGLFIAMPSRRAVDGEFRDIAHPINSETRERIQNIILDEYRKEMTAEDEAELEIKPE